MCIREILFLINIFLFKTFERWNREMVESRVSRLNKKKSSKMSVLYNIVGICFLALILFVGSQMFL